MAGAIALLVALAIAAKGFWELAQERARRQRLRPVQAKLTRPGDTAEARMVERTDSEGKTTSELMHVYWASWDYEVGGQRFTGEVESAAPIFRKADLPPARVTVFYDPEKPAFSRVSQHSDGGGVRSWFIFAGVVAVEGALLLAIPMQG